MEDMTNLQFNAFLDTLAKLIANAKSVQEAVKIVEDAKIKD